MTHLNVLVSCSLVNLLIVTRVMVTLFIVTILVVNLLITLIIALLLCPSPRVLITLLTSLPYLLMAPVRHCFYVYKTYVQ